VFTDAAPLALKVHTVHSVLWINIMQIDQPQKGPSATLSMSTYAAPLALKVYAVHSLSCNKHDMQVDLQQND
jgi:hypothetical protein